MKDQTTSRLAAVGATEISAVRSAAGLALSPVHPRGRAAGGIRISPVDARILEGIARGDSNHQLAARLYLSRQGVEYRIGRLRRSLKAANRTALISRAHFHGMFVDGIWPPKVAPACVSTDDG